MRKISTAVALAAAFALAGCAALSGQTQTPDEFAVARNAPLIIPPDFSLAPPVAGTVTNAPDIQQQAIDALFGGPAPRSASETVLLDEAGRALVPQGIRSTAWDPDTRVVDKGPTTMSILSAAEANSNIASAQLGQ
jgi:hypothetical protein